MDEDARELTRAFLLRWSTTELTTEAKKLLYEDIMSVEAALDALGADTTILEEAKTATDRHWFAKKRLET